MGRSRALRGAALRLPPGLLDPFLMVMAVGAASCLLAPDSLVISSGWWMTEVPLAPLQWQKKTRTRFCPHIWLSSLRCFFLFFFFPPDFHQLLKNSTHHIGSAAAAEAKNETCVAGHRCSTRECVQLAWSVLSGHHLTLLWFYHRVIHGDTNICWAQCSWLLFLMWAQTQVHCRSRLQMWTFAWFQFFLLFN